MYRRWILHNTAAKYLVKANSGIYVRVSYKKYVKIPPNIPQYVPLLVEFSLQNTPLLKYVLERYFGSHSKLM